jgi:hypothetical protein
MATFAFNPVACINAIETLFSPVFEIGSVNCAGTRRGISGKLLAESE